MILPPAGKQIKNISQSHKNLKLLTGNIGQSRPPKSRGSLADLDSELINGSPRGSRAANKYRFNRQPTNVDERDEFMEFSYTDTVVSNRFSMNFSHA